MPASPERNTIGSPDCRSVATAPYFLGNFSMARPPTAEFTNLVKASPFIKPRLGMPQSMNCHLSNGIAISCNSKPFLPEAYRAPTSEPALVPITMSGTIPCASSALMTPMCAKPLAAPPPRASAITGFAFGGFTATWAGAVVGVLLQPVMAITTASKAPTAVLPVFLNFMEWIVRYWQVVSFLPCNDAAHWRSAGESEASASARKRAA